MLDIESKLPWNPHDDWNGEVDVVIAHRRLVFFGSVLFLVLLLALGLFVLVLSRHEEIKGQEQGQRYQYAGPTEHGVLPDVVHAHLHQVAAEKGGIFDHTP